MSTGIRSLRKPLDICNIIALLEIDMADIESRPMRFSAGMDSNARPKPIVACRVADTITIITADATTIKGSPSSKGLR